MPQPLDFDVKNIPWQISTKLKENLQGITSLIMIHITSWQCTRSLFKESSNLLNNHNRQFLLLYDPFKINNKNISKSNELFDKSLKMKRKNWGVRE